MCFDWLPKSLGAARKYFVVAIVPRQTIWVVLCWLRVSIVMSIPRVELDNLEQVFLMRNTPSLIHIWIFFLVYEHLRPAIWMRLSPSTLQSDRDHTTLKLIKRTGMYYLCFQKDDKTFSILVHVCPCACTCEGERMTLRKSLTFSTSAHKFWESRSGLQASAFIRWAISSLRGFLDLCRLHKLPRKEKALKLGFTNVFVISSPCSLYSSSKVYWQLLHTTREKGC